MSKTLFEDAARRPELFIWESSLDSEWLRGFLHRHSLDIPEDLLSFWEKTGGGEIFESEYFLSPVGNATLGEELLSYNEELRSRGMSSNYLVFHTGMTLSAVRLEDRRYVELDYSNFEERADYADLEDWYVRLIRAEYAERYGL